MALAFSDYELGIIVTMSVLVAAGVAAYQSPQFQQWVTTSRRKLAVALHNLGDEIHPRDPIREDISMTEEVGEAADERRRIARLEIIRRAALLESQKAARDSQRPLDSFDTLVDNNGNLRSPEDEHDNLTKNPVATSTGVDAGTSLPLRRGVKSNDDGAITLNETQLLSLEVPSAPASNHPSESVVQYTPTSELPDGDALFDPFTDSPVRGQTPVSATASSHTEGHDVYYAHPQPTFDFSQRPDLLADLDELNQGNHSQHEVSSAASTAGSYSHVHELADATSDGTLSDLGVRSVGGVATPASWSEVGSVVSSDDAGHQ